MTFDKKIALYNLQKGYGSNPQPIRIDEKIVWCSVDTIGAANAINAMSAGLKLSRQVEMWAREYDGEGFATLGGKDYKVETPAQSYNPLTIKLLLSRG